MLFSTRTQPHYKRYGIDLWPAPGRPGGSAAPWRLNPEIRRLNLNPGQKTLTYSVADLQQYVDSMHDVSLMVSDPQTKQYGACSRRQEKQKLLPALFALAQLMGCTCTMLAAPKGKAFLKQMLMQRLKSAVA